MDKTTIRYHRTSTIVPKILAFFLVFKKSAYGFYRLVKVFPIFGNILKLKIIVLRINTITIIYFAVKVSISGAK